MAVPRRGGTAGDFPTQGPFSPELTVVVPTYNEERNVPRLLAALDEALDGVPYEVVIVDDASADRTLDAAAGVPIRGRLRAVRKPARTGKPSSLAIGLAHAEGRHVAFIDADMEYHPRVLREMLRAAAHADIVAARRRDRRPLPRRLTSTGARLLTKLLVPELRRLGDPTTELVLARRGALDGLEGRLTHIKPITYALLDAARRGLRIAEVDVDVEPRTQGTSSFRPRWVLAYARQLMDMSNWLLPKYIAVALAAAAVARALSPILGAASLAVSLALRYAPLRRHLRLPTLLAAEAASTTAKLALMPLAGPMALAVAAALEIALIAALR